MIVFMKIYLETKRMIFLKFEVEDHGLIKDLDSDPDVVKYISNGIVERRMFIANTVMPSRIIKEKILRIFS